MNNEDKASFFDYLMESGMDAKEAVELTEFKGAVASNVEWVTETLNLCRTLPLKLVPNFETLSDKEKKKLLWELGFNTNNYQYCIDVRCHKWNNKTVCEKVIIGEERRDHQWRNKIVNGQFVASDAARYGMDLGCTKGMGMWDATVAHVKEHGLEELSLED